VGTPACVSEDRAGEPDSANGRSSGDHPVLNWSETAHQIGRAVGRIAREVSAIIGGGVDTARSAPLAGCGKTYLLMKSLSAPCDKTGFLPLVFPLGEITERGSRVRKAFFRSLLVAFCVSCAAQRRRQIHRREAARRP